MSEYDYTQIQTTGKFMALSCTHGNLVDPKALTKFIRAKAKYKPKHMLHLGDCFPRDVEILTENGFVRFDELDDGVKVGQITRDGRVEMVDPLKRIVKKYDGKLLRHHNNSYDIATTPTHKMVVYNKLSGIERKVLSKDLPSYQAYRIPRTAIYDGEGVDFTDDEIRLQVAIMADFSKNQGCEGFRAGFKKDRKKKRIVELLKSVGLKYTVSEARPDYLSVRISAKNGVTKFSKEIKRDWLLKLSHAQAMVFLEELSEWDGHADPKRNRCIFSSSRFQERAFVSELCAIHGIQSTMQRDGKRVNILWSKKDTLADKLQTDEIDSDGTVFCVTVPSGKIMVKYNSRISVCGNCFEFTALRKGASEDEKRLDIEEDIEAGLNTLKRVFNGITGERWCLRGNHCQRLWDMADKGSVISQDFAKVHIKRIEDFFAEHKIKTKPYCSTQGVIQINDLLAMHGYGFGVNAAKDHLKIYHNHVIFGHTHRAEEAVGTGWPKPIVAINCGMMMQKFPKYASRTTSVLSWTHAFVKGEFLKDGTHTKKLVTL